MKIMDVTLRDGSYQINFQFSNGDVRNIGGGLDALGLPYIEIGHGVGIGASSYRYGIALHTDEEYLQAAKKHIHNAKVGMFCLPGVASLDQLERLCDMGLNFVRIGTNVDQVRQSEKYIRKAKQLGVMVTANYMKSYAVSPDFFAEQVKISQACGADCVYLVDSAGSMLPEDILRYYEAIRKVSDLPLGFHGHNNLGLALSNSLYAASLGFEIIDTSLQGLGRSAGNASTEQLVAVLQKQGLCTQIDCEQLLLLGKKYVSPLVRGKGIDPVDVVCGMTGFHSSYLQAIHRQAGKYEVDPLLLIEEYTKIDQINMDEKRLEQIAAGLPKVEDDRLLVDMHEYLVNEQK